MIITLKNFQIHKKLSLEIKDGFNCIMGGNNRGKSSIVRAIKWFLTNAPAGNWMCRRDAAGKTYAAVVKLQMDDGNVLKRVKGAGKNYYALNDQEYHDIGRKVPVEILTALGVGNAPLARLGLDMNIEMQEDMPFLVHEASTAKAGALNVLTGINIIENTIKEFNKDRLAHNRKMSYLEEEIDKQIVELEKYDGLENIDLTSCEKRFGDIDRLKAELDRLSALSQEHSEKTGIIKQYECLKDAAKDLLEMERLLVDVQIGRRDLDWLGSVSKRLAEYMKFTKPTSVDFGDAGAMLAGLVALHADFDRLRSLSQCLLVAEANMRSSHREMAAIGKKMVGKVCPTCGAIIKRIPCHG